MELTQRLECTQEVFSKCTEKEFPDQIGFLGICGTKYPLKKGPNKIGRDPDTCNINLNLNSISRQHAVINILNTHEYMLMDLDSANKTKLCDKTLEAYIPYPLKNGDMVQFGQVFGVFRLFEEDNNLPLTQAIDVPETPVHSRHTSKLNTIYATTIPESPDVSDKDDSFIVASQTKRSTNVFKSPNNRFIKTSGSTISIKPIGTNKIDNAYWSSSKKSDSFSSQSNISNNDLSLPPILNASDLPNIHEINTQVNDNHNDTMDSIYDANTQFIGNPIQSTIYNMETQLPSDLPEVCKIQDQQNLNFNFTTENKENDNNIYNAETQIEPNVLNNISELESTDKEDDNKIIVFEEIESQALQDNLESQALLPPEFDDINVNKDDSIEDKKESNIQKCTKRVHRLKSDSSTDCEDEDINIAMTQNIHQLIDDDITDCEDEPETNNISTKQTNNDITIDDNVTDCEDNFDEDGFIKPKNLINELDTQILEIGIEHSNITKDDNKIVIKEEKNTQIYKEEIVVCMEDLPTQVIEEETEKTVCFEEALTQKIHLEEIVPFFKVPKPSPIIDKKKNVSDLKHVNQMINNEHRNSNENVDDSLYYAATQDIFNDLCSQREPSPTIEIPSEKRSAGKNNKVIKLSAAKTITPLSPSSVHHSTDDSDIDDKIDSFVSNLSKSQIMDVVGINKVSSGSPVPKVTLKKTIPGTCVETKLPSTGDIKNNFTVNKKNKNRKRDIPSELETANDIHSHIEFPDRKKEPFKSKTSLTKKHEVEIIPTRIVKRIRKPTIKMLSYDETVQIASLATGNTTEKNKKSKSEKINTKEKSNNQISEKADERCKTKAYDKTKGEKNKSDNETRGRKRTKEKEESKLTDKQTKRTTAQPGNKKKIKDITHYLDYSQGRTRSRSKQKSEAVNEKILETETKEKPQTRLQSSDKRGQNTRTEKIIEKCESPLKSVRRSRRHRSSKKTEETQNDTIPKANLSLETSAVYNISFDPLNKVNFKRSATESIEFPSAKKTRTETNPNNVSLRANPDRKVKTHYVLFTAFPCEEVKIKLEKLGATIVSDVMQCTVVLTMQIKRTFKLLCALGLGKPIVGPSWVQICADTNMIVDPWLHLIKDEVTENRFQFSLQRSLSVRRGFLKGYNISSTPSVTPNAQEMKSIVECSGGTWKSKGPNWICVSAIPDKALWPALKKKGAIIVSTEFILAGVLRQKVEIDKNKLD